MSFTVIELEDIPVAFVKVEGGPTHAAKAFAELEARMGSFRGKRFYGVFDVNTGEYRACVRLDENNPDSMGLDSGTIPGRKYARTKIVDWTGKEHTIGPTFDELVKNCIESGHEIDITRPSIEFYRSQQELFLLVPISN